VQISRKDFSKISITPRNQHNKQELDKKRLTFEVTFVALGIWVEID
jgi:hypothetical protein